MSTSRAYLLVVLFLVAAWQSVAVSWGKEFDGHVENDAASKNPFGVLIKITAPFHDRPANVIVRSVLKSSRAEEVGLRKGDEIISVDGKAVRDVPTDQIPKLFKGAPGSQITMVISRKGEESTLSFNRSRPDRAADPKLDNRLQRQVDIDERRQQRQPDHEKHD